MSLGQIWGQPKVGIGVCAKLANIFAVSLLTVVGQILSNWKVSNFAFLTADCLPENMQVAGGYKGRLVGNQVGWSGSAIAFKFLRMP